MEAMWVDRLKCQSPPVPVFNFDGIGTGGVKTNPTVSARSLGAGYADTKLLFSGDENLPWGVVELAATSRGLAGPALQMMSAGAGKSVAVEFRLPRAQRVQFSVANLDVIGKTLHISGRCGVVDVRPRAVPAVAVGGVTVIDGTSSVELRPAGAGGFVSPVDERAVADVVFHQPVDVIVIRNVGEAGDSSPWVVTRAEGCQTADVLLWSEGVSR